MRELKEGQVMLHFKGFDKDTCEFDKKYAYIIVHIAKSADDLRKIVVYKSIHTGQVWVRDYDEFNSEVDREKYPDAPVEMRLTNLIDWVMHLKETQGGLIDPVFKELIKLYDVKTGGQNN